MSDGVSPLEFLQSIYRDEAVPLPVRMRAAIEAANYVHPKLSMNANVGFAAQMEATQRSVGLSPVIDVKPLAQPTDSRMAHPERASDIG